MSHNANRACTWQSLADEITELTRLMGDRAPELKQRMAPPLVASLVAKIGGLRDFGTAATFGLYDAVASWDTCDTLAAHKADVEASVARRTDAESTGLRKGDTNKNAVQQVCDCPNYYFTKSEIDRLGDRITSGPAALELIADRAGKIGITNAAEVTTRWWVALHVAFVYDRTAAFPSYHSIHDDVCRFKQLLAGNHGASSSGVKVYPRDPAALGKRVLDAAYAANDSPITWEVPNLVNLALNHVPLRSNSKLLADEASRTRRDLEAYSNRGRAGPQRGRTRAICDATEFDEPPRQKRRMELSPYEFKPAQSPRSRLDALALTNAPHDWSQRESWQGSEWAVEHTPPPNDGRGIVVPPPPSHSVVPYVPPVVTDQAANGADAEAIQLAIDIAREEAALDSIVKRDIVRKDTAKEKAAHKKAADKAVAKAQSDLAAAKLLDAAAMGSAKPGKSAKPKVPLSAGKGAKTVKATAATIKGEKPPAKVAAFDMKYVIKVSLKHVLTVAEVSDYATRREAYGCRGYTLVNAELSSKSMNVVVATRKWARAQLLNFWDKHYKS